MEKTLDPNPEASSSGVSVSPKVYPSITQGFALIGILILISIILAFPAYWLKHHIDPQYQPALESILYVVSIVMLLLFAFAMRKSVRLQWSKVSWEVLLLTIPLILSLYILNDPLDSIIPMPEFFKNMYNQTYPVNLYSILAFCIAAPLFEEMIFRGVVLQGFLKRYSPTKAIIVSALIFSLAHLNPVQFLTAFTLGLLLGWIYWKTNSLLSSIFIHACNNIISFAIQWLTSDLFSFQKTMGDAKIYYIVYGMCIPIFIGTLFYIDYKIKSKKSETV